MKQNNLHYTVNVTTITRIAKNTSNTISWHTASLITSGWSSFK